MTDALAVALTVTAVIGGLLMLFVAVRLLQQLAEATDRIAEIMRRSHAADLDRYDERVRGEGEGDIDATPLHSPVPDRARWQTMS